MARSGWGVGGPPKQKASSSPVMNNRTACWSLSRLPSLTSFSGLWKCFTIPLMASPTPSWIWPVFNSGREQSGQSTGAHRKEDFSSQGQCCPTMSKNEDTFPLYWDTNQLLNKTYLGLKWWFLVNLLGLVFGEMVTNLLIILGDCCIGGVRHILSSFSVVGVINSPTRILSRLPSSTPFPNHRPQGNLQDDFVSFCSGTQRSTKHCSVFSSLQRHTHL